MQSNAIKFFSPVTFLFFCVTCYAQTSTDQTSSEKSYPDEFALVTGSDSQLSYVKFPEGLTLYVYDGDEPGKSNCNGGCAAAWPPVLAKADAEPIGDWTPIVRDDGSKQWAYKQTPVYLYFHDVPGRPLGAEQAGWNLLDTGL